MNDNIKFAPRELFEQILEYMVIPTFDLLLEMGTNGIVIVRRSIEPYKNVWALPGLRMYKGESINDSLIRVAKKEVGLDINPESKEMIGQYVGKFKTENNRQDLSTCYLVRVTQNQPIVINKDHFSDYRITRKIPSDIGAMYKYYINKYLSDSQKK